MKILYICTHNRCRSILSEAITNQNAKGHIVARSAGSQPAGDVHPLSIQYLEKNHYTTANLESQSWDEFADFEPDLVITVCDAAAGESCPLYFSHTTKLHWGLADPSKVVGSDKEKAAAFQQCIAEIEKRVNTLTALAKKSPDNQTLAQQLTQFGAQL